MVGFDIQREAICDTIQYLFRSLALSLPTAELESWQRDSAESAMHNANSFMKMNCSKRVNLKFMDTLLDRALGYDDEND